MKVIIQKTERDDGDVRLLFRPVWRATKTGTDVFRGYVALPVARDVCIIEIPQQLEEAPPIVVGADDRHAPHAALNDVDIRADAIGFFAHNVGMSAAHALIDG
jgi:hypothetical protein